MVKKKSPRKNAEKNSEGGLTKRKLTYRQTRKEYLEGKIKLERWQKVGILLLVIVFAGFIGWVWEFMLAEVSHGFRHLYIKGGNLLPWMNIYAYGAIIIMVVSHKLKKYPWVVFLASAVACGLLELFAGWVVYTVGNGTRYWDYSHEWWALGNINGFVCPVSAAAFGLGALALMYWLLPHCIHMARTMTKKHFLAFAITLFTLVMVDDITNLTLKNLDLPTANELYYKMGWVYQ